jgi:hypothetical protein
MAFQIHEAPPMQARRLCSLLNDAGVRFVMTGSFALYCHGARIVPRDLDVVPELSEANLQSLVGLLAELAAQPVWVPEWAGSLSAEQCDNWAPSPATAAQLDHLLITRLGLLDVVPCLTGSYDELLPYADLYQLGQVKVRIASVYDLLVKCRTGSRRKEERRRAELVKLAHRGGLDWDDLPATRPARRIP